jgi:hypothetical protein
VARAPRKSKSKTSRRIKALRKLAAAQHVEEQRRRWAASREDWLNSQSLSVRDLAQPPVTLRQVFKVAQQLKLIGLDKARVITMGEAPTVEVKPLVKLTSSAWMAREIRKMIASGKICKTTSGAEVARELKIPMSVAFARGHLTRALRSEKAIENKLRTERLWPPIT